MTADRTSDMQRIHYFDAVPSDFFSASQYFGIFNNVHFGVRSPFRNLFSTLSKGILTIFIVQYVRPNQLI